jgi:hypothetical protein
VAAEDDDGPLSPELEQVRKLLFPNDPEEVGRARIRAVLKRAEEERGLDDALFERLRGREGAGDDPSVAWARAVLTDMDDHTSAEIAEVVVWLEAEPTRAAEVFGSLLEAFHAGLRAGERL